MYLTFATNRIYLVTARARSGDLVPQAVKQMRQLIGKPRWKSRDRCSE